MPGMYFEAMSAALPMVLAENDTSAELKSNKFGGIIVKQKSPELLAKAVLKIMDNSTLYKEYSSRNYTLMQTVYNFNNAINQLKKILLPNEK